jgi:2,4-dienoyl-CoA reductase-like NADH-dependent reductase (Old Yellow Enzyme family)
MEVYEMLDLSLLFQEFSHQNIKLSNRIVMAPMTRSFSPNHVPTEQVAEYYRRRAKHGVGLIITEGACIDHPAANGHADIPFMFGDEALAGWKNVVEAVHAEGGKIIPQLWHVGAVRPVGSEPNPSVPAYSPSGLSAPGQHSGHAMTRQDIIEL